MGCTSGAMKCALNILNTIMAIFGVALIALATLSLNSAPTSYITYLYIVGGINFIAAMLGCCGVCQENVCMTTTYAIIIGVSLISQVVGKFVASDSAAIREFAAKDVQMTWQKEIQYPGAMNSTQQTYHCCGKNSPDDYYNIGRQFYPASCYPEMVVNQTALYRTGCIQAAEESFLKLFNYSSSGEWTNLALMAVMLLCAIYLIVRFLNKERSYDY